MTEDTLKLMAFVAISLFILFVLLAGEAYLRRRALKKAGTPVTEKGLTQYDELPPGIAVAMAWSEAGIDDTWHRTMQDEVRTKMPVLGRALDRLVDND